MRCLIPKFKSYSRRCRRITMDVPLQKLSLIGRSRPFLLCVILILVGFLWVHFVSPSSNLNLVVADVNVNTAHRLRNQSGENGLYVDELSHGNQSLDDILDTNTQSSSTETTNMDSLSFKSCTKKKFDVSFLKVHKAGSTTLMNIFLRFAIEHNLNIVLPHKSSGYGFNYLGYGETVSKSKIVPLPKNETYNILCNHVVYNRAAFRSIMPKDTAYVGIIREPVSHFSSAALYYGFYNHLRELSEGNVPKERVVSEFLKNPAQVNIQTYFVNNRMCFDFGIPKDKFHDNAFVDQYIEELDEDYELVLILERFQESLVLMKRILCWDTKDILYVPLNAMKSKPDFDLDDNDIENLRKWNGADFKLYDHFYDAFDAKVEALGQDFQEEVESFKSIQEEVKEYCNTAFRARDTTSVFTVPATKWCDNFTVTVRDCRLMMEAELSMMKRLIDSAWARYDQYVEQNSAKS